MCIKLYSMKSFIKLFILVILCSVQLKGIAQDKVLETYAVPLSQPNQIGKLYVDLQNGTIQVQGYNGKEVSVQFVEKEDRHKNNNDWGWDSHDNDRNNSKKGLKKISSNYIDLEIEENNNTVYVKGSHNRRSDLIIKVPTNFNLKLKAHHNGDINVSNVIGELEITSHHGEIIIDKVGGSVIADTHHGKIKGSLVSVTPNVPMAFSTYHGDVDIAFPTSIKCDTKIKTAKGDIYTDFDLNLKSLTSKKTTSNGRRQIKIGGWMYGNIGSGGEEFLFNTHHGDVVIRQL